MTWSHMVYNVQIDPAMSTMSHHAQREDVRLLPRCTHMMCNGRTCDHMWPTYRQSDAKAAHMSEGLSLRAYPQGVSMDCPNVRTYGQGLHESTWNARRGALDCEVVEVDALQCAGVLLNSPWMCGPSMTATFEPSNVTVTAMFALTFAVVRSRSIRGRFRGWRGRGRCPDLHVLDVCAGAFMFPEELPTFFSPGHSVASR